MTEKSIYRHSKSGGFYEVLGAAINEMDLNPVTIYRCLKTRIPWVRLSSEFYDGRFEKLSDIDTKNIRNSPSTILDPKSPERLAERLAFLEFRRADKTPDIPDGSIRDFLVILQNHKTGDVYSRIMNFANNYQFYYEDGEHSSICICPDKERPPIDGCKLYGWGEYQILDDTEYFSGLGEEFQVLEWALIPNLEGGHNEHAD